jgi:hypothetical protein
MDLNRGLFLQSQDYRYIEISLDKLKENPTFTLSILRSILAPYLTAGIELSGDIAHKFNKVDRDLMRQAIRHHRVVRPARVARELELHKETVLSIVAYL